MNKTRRVALNKWKLRKKRLKEKQKLQETQARKS